LLSGYLSVAGIADLVALDRSAVAEELKYLVSERTAAAT
jgi:hypothetical protein